MKLNADCIRAVMLEIEKLHKVFVNDVGCVEKASLHIGKLYEALPQYGKEDVFYTLYNLEQAGYIDLSTQWGNGQVYNCVVNHMTFAGHEFLNSIRDDKRWSAIKNGLSAIRDYSLSAIASVAEGVANAAINAYLQKLQL